jgi:hypothetical protein
MISSMQQMFEMFQTMQRQAPQQQFTMPPPPANPDMGSMMGWMQQMFEMFRSMQPPPQQSARGAHHQQQQPAMANPMMAMMGMPPVQPPPGTIWVPGFGFIPLERLTQAIGGGGGGPGGDGSYRPPYRPPYGPRSPYGPSGPPGYTPQAQPQKSAAEQFREALTVVRTAVEAVQDINNMLPHQMTGAPAQESFEDDDSPVQVIDTGPAKIVVNKKDGSLRGWETGWANMDKVLKWVGEQREQIQRAQQQQQQPQQRRVLPPGYVEVGPGYRPPPGFVAVPVEDVPQEEEEELPPPPAHMPGPVDDAASAPTSTSRPVWGPPTIPDGES